MSISFKTFTRKTLQFGELDSPRGRKRSHKDLTLVPTPNTRRIILPASALSSMLSLVFHVALQSKYEVVSMKLQNICIAAERAKPNVALQTFMSILRLCLPVKSPCILRTMAGLSGPMEFATPLVPTTKPAGGSHQQGYYQIGRSCLCCRLGGSNLKDPMTLQSVSWSILESTYHIGVILGYGMLLMVQTLHDTVRLYYTTRTPRVVVYFGIFSHAGFLSTVLPQSWGSAGP